MTSLALSETGWEEGEGGEGGGDPDVFMLPPIDLGLAVAAVRAVHDVCDNVLDKLYEVTEEDCTAALEKTLKKGAELIKKLSNKLIEHEDQVCEHYVKFQALQDHHEAIRRIPEGANRLPDGGWWAIEDEKDEEEEGERDLESGEGGGVLSTVTQDEARAKEFRDSHLGVVGFLNDMEAACVEFTEEEMEELAEVGLFCARMATEYAQGLARRSLRMLEKDYDWAAAEEKQRERGEHLIVEEATEEEIVALYRSRGEEPPPPSSTTTNDNNDSNSSSSSTSNSAAREEDANNYSFFSDPSRARPLAPPPSSGRARRGRGAPSRVLWQPLGPTLLQALLSTPQHFKAHPYKTTGAYAALLPVSGIVIFCLPGVLMTDAVLQSFYKRVGPGVEVWVHDGKEICRLSWMVSRLSLRQTYRFVRKQLRRAGADPVMALQGVGEVVYEAVTHPLETVGMVWGQAKTTVAAAGKMVGWAQKQVLEK